MSGTTRAYALLPIRLIMGFGLTYHGWPKLFDAQGRQGFEATLRGLGFPVAGLLSWAVGVIEVFGGLALIAGAFVGIAAALLIVIQIVALVKVHLPNGFNFIHITGMTDAGAQFGLPGYEVNLLYLAGLSALLLGGAGALSVDQVLAHKRRGGSSGTGAPGSG
jgi:putative oxidoreductase